MKMFRVGDVGWPRDFMAIKCGSVSLNDDLATFSAAEMVAYEIIRDQCQSDEWRHAKVPAKDDIYAVSQAIGIMNAIKKRGLVISKNGEAA